MGTRLVIAVALALGFAGLAVDGMAGATTPITVVPYGSSGYQYLQVAHGGGDPNFDDVGFNNNAFGTGTAGFGSPGCAPSPAATPWSVDTDLLLRRHVSLPAGTTNVVVHVAIDNDITVFWNGTSLGKVTHEGCAAEDNVTYSVPAALLTVGDNVLAARAVDRGVVAYVDLQVTADRANQPPECSSVVASQATLWPPNHGLQTVTVSGGSDPDGGAVSVAVAGVTQDEALNGTGDGDAAPDASTSGLPTNAVALRAERSGNGDGRVYRIGVLVTDTDGASCSTTVFVGVPKSQGRFGGPVDTVGVVVNSFGP